MSNAPHQLKHFHDAYCDDKNVTPEAFAAKVQMQIRQQVIERRFANYIRATILSPVSFKQRLLNCTSITLVGA